MLYYSFSMRFLYPLFDLWFFENYVSMNWKQGLKPFWFITCMNSYVTRLSVVEGLSSFPNFGRNFQQLYLIIIKE